MRGEIFLSIGLKYHQPEVKPREKAQKNGVDTLSYQELLAIILRTGNKEKNVLDLSNELLLSFDNLFELKTASIHELQKIEGIGPVKAVEIQAAIELGRRLAIEDRKKKGQVLSSVDLAEELIIEMKDYEQEHFIVLYLNAKNEVLKKKTLFIGSLNQSVAHPREIFKLAVKTSTARMIIVHNHPSGNPSPSMQDIAFTERIVECGRLMGIDILDHLIIGEKSYTSLKEEGFI